MSRTSNHARAPFSAEIVSAYRAVFGEDAMTVEYVNENGILKGERCPDGAPCFTFAIPEQKKAKRARRAA